MSGIHLLSPPLSPRCLINLHTPCLDRCRLEDVAIIGELKELEILNFLEYDIEQLPIEIGQLTGLSLTCLEELYMVDSFDQWDIDGRRNASLVELKQLSCLTALDLQVPNARIIPKDLSFVK
ncbi:hypothetical protein Ddye_013145 [Dipteronia dyeriana]|uniref:Uncharacterized protein n=1 Tax=Dipteronia dyeriana TaxID=168575 RepID=A0AAE0CJC7_9ROSI|nr:hypothetical protein Ddye_013145 [Dipteronia dyeriana]